MTQLGASTHARHARPSSKGRWVAATVVALAAVMVLALVAFAGGPTRSASSQRSATHPTAATSRPTGTFLGPYGVESKAIIAENRLPGTTSWQITGTPPAGFIEGFADTTYASEGQSVGLYVSTSAPRFRVVAYRMGWYQGKGGHEVWASPEVPGTEQPPCPLTQGINMVSCDNWSKSLTIPITEAFMQGDYLLKLVGSGGQQSYVPLTVWDPASTAAYLVMARSLTEEGWNTFGGYSYYQGEGPCTLGQTSSYPPCNRARVVSFDRPYDTGNGSSDFLTNEFPLVSFMERHGLDAAYVTDVTVDEHPQILLRHRAILSLGHDETWTWPELQGAETALAHGVNIVFFGAAALVRHSRLQPSPLGPDREEVDYRDETEDPLDGTGNAMEVTGNTFSSPPADLPPTELTGETYAGYLDAGVEPVPFVVENASAWIFKGTGLADGSSIPGVIVSDIDHLDPSEPTPSNIEVLGHSPVSLSEAYTNQGQWGNDTYSDMTYYSDPTSGGGVLDTGTVNWIFAMGSCVPSQPGCPAATLEKITANLLWLFGQGPAGKLVPPVPNAQAVSPPGS